MEMTDYGHARQRKIPDDVEHFVTHELVVESQPFFVDNGVAVDEDGIVS